MQSQGYPNHPTADFPNSGNPNSIRVQEFTFRLPLEPRLAPQITRLPMGPIGVALNGVVFFNPFEQGGMNAVEGYSEVWLDSCCGHPQQTGVYHYHKYPTCVKSPFPDDGTRHSPVIGFAFDGFPIHGPYESDGVMAKDVDGSAALDACNGHSDVDRGYHYHVTPGRFPYVIGGYRGVPEASNNRGLRHAGTGAVDDNAEGKSRMEAVIVDVRPGAMPRGGRREVTIVLDQAGARRGPVPAGKPSWVQIGPYEAVTIDRQGDAVTATFDIPADASVGMLLDCHIEFTPAVTGRPVVVFKRNDVMRVAE
jgi:YHYH protein